MQTETTELSNQPFVLPASFAQQRMWFLDRLEGASATYNVPIASRLRGRLDVRALERALAAVVTRHETLRTTFCLVDGAPHQVISPPAPFGLEMIDVSTDADPEARALELTDAHGRRSFDLSSEQLLRALLIKLAGHDHILSLTIHHIIVDAWSVGVLNRELSKLYGAFVEGRELDLPELAVQYGDYAVWQLEWMRSGGLEGQLEYWRGKLAGAPAMLELPTDKPRPPRQRFRGATLRTVLPRELLEQLKALGEREGTTLFMTLLAAYAVLLSRYSGQQDIVVASPVANRNRIELEGLIGLFVNTLALRVQLDGDPSFGTLLSSVRETALEAFANQELPFERLVEELNPERHLSHAPMAQVLFVLQDTVEDPVTFTGLEREPLRTDRGTAKFDLSLFIGEVPEGLGVAIEYCLDLFEESTVQRMLEHFGVLLEGALADPGCPVSRLPVLPHAERELVVGEWSAGPGGHRAERPVHELVAARVRRAPEQPAVRFGNECLSYAELESRGNRLGRYLRGLGVGPDTVVGICAERSVELVVAVLGVLKAGGAYAPIDPAYPADRVAFMLSDCAAPVLLTQERLVSRVPSSSSRVVCLDSDWEAIAACDDHPVPSGVSLDHLAYVLFTSGSTGRPKGVAMGHRPLSNLIEWQLEALPGAARTLQFASLSFDVAFQELFVTWCAGGTLVLVDEETRRDPQALASLLVEQGVERLFLPFVALDNLCEAAELLELSVPSLREVVTAGEQLKSTQAIRGFFSRHRGCRLFNQYGPTESHVVTAFELSGEPERWPALPPIGRPISGARVYLLDRHLQPVPVGVPGELCIGGVSLARGYLNRPDLTAERFVEDRFAGEDGARIYRTGDLARFRGDGEIEYLDRIDHQVKIRGFRIEPGEIEAVLREHPGLREALVIARQEPTGDRRLIAYVLAQGPAPETAELAEFLHRRVPEYMVPAAFVKLDAFPLTPNGKIDRNALPAPDTSQLQTAAYTPPRTEHERRLAEIWQRLLDVDRVGIHDNFFELGGHSLLAVRLFAEIERKLGARLPLSSLFETATIGGLAGLIDSNRGTEGAWASVVPMRSGIGEGALFLIAGADGEVLVYRALVEHLPPGLPVYGLQPPGRDRRTEPLTSVEALASYYVREMRGVQPNGPYRLGGYCFSGLVAYEMARQLLVENESVELLALIDSFPVRPGKGPGRVEIERRKFQAFWRADLQSKRAWVFNRLLSAPAWVSHVVHETKGPLLYEALVSRNLHRWVPRRPWNLVWVAGNLARVRYVPQPADVRAAFVRSQRTDQHRPTPFDRLARKGVDARSIVAPDIDHTNMMSEPHVKLLAAELTSLLDGAVAPTSNGRSARLAPGALSDAIDRPV